MHRDDWYDWEIYENQINRAGGESVFYPEKIPKNCKNIPVTPDKYIYTVCAIYSKKLFKT